jgi:hypothetical protein
MAQYGQVLKLRTRRMDGKAVWAYRYRVNGRHSKRPQVGGFSARAEADRALRRELDRLRPGAEMKLSELVTEYLEVHQAAPATIEKLRWLLAKATAAFGEVRLVELRAEEICAWRATLPEGHRFEATQVLRQVLHRAVAWQLIDVNPAKRGVSNGPASRRFPRCATVLTAGSEKAPSLLTSVQTCIVEPNDDDRPRAKMGGSACGARGHFRGRLFALRRLSGAWPLVVAEEPKDDTGSRPRGDWSLIKGRAGVCLR